MHTHTSVVVAALLFLPSRPWTSRGCTVHRSCPHSSSASPTRACAPRTRGSLQYPSTSCSPPG